MSHGRGERERERERERVVLTFKTIEGVLRNEHKALKLMWRETLLLLRFVHRLFFLQQHFF